MVKKRALRGSIVLVLILITVSLCFAMTACNKTEKTEEYKFGKELISLDGQLDILKEMNEGRADIGIMDSVMAGYYLTHGRSKYTIERLPFYLSEEEYGIGAKKENASLIEKINEGLVALAGNGTMATLAEAYGLHKDVLVKGDTEYSTGATDTAWNNVVTSAKLTIGYTVFAPIAFESNGELVGYDIELAKSVVAYLNEKYSCNIECEFKVIEWNKKTDLLNDGSIDLVWNGMTISDDRLADMCVSVPYLSNRQAILILQADKEKYDLTTFDSFMESASEARVAVETDSAAEKIMLQK